VSGNDLVFHGDLDLIERGADDDLAVGIDGGSGVWIALEANEAGAGDLRRPDQMTGP
jgi:hypothetical protein